MKCAVCTLFERDFHYGLAALTNSLVKSGFSGTIYAGFRGPLPPWARKAAKSLGEGQWRMEVTPEVAIRFIEQKTEIHFTNFKPQFLLEIEKLVGSETDGVIYCDPDLIFNVDWRYITDWLTCGIAMCEDINSPMPENHPKRVGWRRFFQKSGSQLHFKNDIYANGGFVGLLWEYRQYLLTWKDFNEQISAFLGGGDVVGISGGRKLKGFYGIGNCFSQPDQDAMNAAIEACPDLPFSLHDRKAMGFFPGTAFLPHALGEPKPWSRHYVWDSLGGVPPTVADKKFWENVSHPIRPFESGKIFFKQISLTLAKSIGRFIHRT